jgi:uncharacterized membrane protein
MLASRARFVAFVLVALLSLPIVPLDALTGGEGADTAAAQTPPQGGVPPEVSFQDWPATHRLYIHNAVDPNQGGTSCTQVNQGNPAGSSANVVGDRACQAPLNTSQPTNTDIFSWTTRETEDTAALTPDNQAGIEERHIAWTRLAPPLTSPIRIDGLTAKVYVEFNPPLTSCASLTGDLGRVTADFEVRALPSNEPGESGEVGQVIGHRRLENICPVDQAGGSNIAGSEVGTKWPIEADIPVVANQLGENYRIQFKVLMARPLGEAGAGTWQLDYDANTAPSYLEVRSPDAFQFAAWMQDQTDRITNTFPIPVNPADRVSAAGFFAFKDAWGGYDNPPAQSPQPVPSDAKWAVRIRAPSGCLVSLQDHGAFPDGGSTGPQPAACQTTSAAGQHEFRDCDNLRSDTVTCLDQVLHQPDNLRVFRMPTRPVAPGSAPVWNYTKPIIDAIAPGGGEFRLEILGSVRSNKIETRLPEGVRFTVGGFGIRMAPLSIAGSSESLVHTFCTPTVATGCQGASTTFLLSVSNLGPRQDNFTLSSQFITSTSQGWGVAFSGQDIHGSKLTLQGGNSSLLKVTLTPPSGAAAGASATVRVRATSDNAPDQFAERDITAQLSSTVTRGAGVFLFPDAATKTTRRGELLTFNYTIWNKGTDTDGFQAFCFDGPDPAVDPLTGRRIDDSWNGTITLGSNTIGCRDQDATRLLTTTIPPGDTATAVVVLQANANNTRSITRAVVVDVKSQGDPQKLERATATATLQQRSSFKVFILTDGTANADDPQDLVKASRTLRLGKDDPNYCPNAGVSDCTGTPGETGDQVHTRACCGEGDSDTFAAVLQQKYDDQYGEWAFYRVTVLNDGDRPQTLKVRIGDVRNQTENNCPGGVDAFTATQHDPNSANNVGMFDREGVMLLRQPVLDQFVDPSSPNRISELPVLPGRSAVFYLRVHMEWNRYNLSRIAGEGSIEGGGAVCSDSLSNVDVVVTDEANAPFPSKSVRATTRAVNRDPLDPSLVKNIVVTEGKRCAPEIVGSDPGSACPSVETFDAQTPQSCPPVTPIDSSEKRLCRYVKPGQTQAWFFTADKFWPIGDEFEVRALRRAGGFSLTDLKNRGWVFGCEGRATDIPCVVQNTRSSGRVNASGDEITLRMDVTVPLNASISDFADLQLEVNGKFAGRSQTFSFLTITAQKFKVNVSSLARGDVFVHPGDRAAVNLNISNEGSTTDKYSITLAPDSALPQGWTVSFEPNETRVSPAKNKTVTVFVNTPVGAGCNVLPSPPTGTGRVRVRSLTNLSEIRGETFTDVAFTVGLKTCGAEDVRMGLQGAAVRPVDSGGSVTFTVNVSNPAPTAKVVALRRLPVQSAVREFVDGWQDVVAESCLDMPARLAPGQPSNKSVAFTVTAARDALEGTHVTYVLRADEFAGSLDNCRTAASIPDNDNFAQSLVTATVIGSVGLEAQALPRAPLIRPGETCSLDKLSACPVDDNAAGVAVVPRSGTVLFPVLVRNVGTANDTMTFQARFLNQSQVLGSAPWSVSVQRGDSGDNIGCVPSVTTRGVLQALSIDPQVGCVVFVNVTVPLNIPRQGEHADVDFVVRATSPQVAPITLRLVAYVQDYDIRLRVTNTTVDAVPGQTLNFLLNITNAGDCPRLCAGVDTFDVQVDIGGLAGFWNVTSEFSAIKLLNNTARDVQISVQVPRVTPGAAPTTGAVLGITVRSRQVESIKPSVEALGAGNPLTLYLASVQKTQLVTVNLFPYVAFDIDDDKDLELAVDRNRNNLDGFEFFTDPFTAIIQSVDLLAADGDDDGRVDHFVDVNLDGRPDVYWDPDDTRLTTVFGGSKDRSGTKTFPDLNNDGTLEFLYDSDGDLAADRWIDPATRRSGVVIAKDFDDDGSAEYIIDTNGDGRPDRYFDPDRGPRGLVTTVELSSAGGGQRYEIDTNGGGRPTKVYDRVTGEVSDARVQGTLEFVATYWYLVLLFLAVAVLGGYLVVQRRRQQGGRRGGGQQP